VVGLALLEQAQNEVYYQRSLLLDCKPGHPGVVTETSAADELLPLVSVAVVALGCRLRHALTQEALHFCPLVVRQEGRGIASVS